MKKTDKSCIEITRRVFDSMPSIFNGVELIEKVRKISKKRYYDSYILREMRKLRLEDGRYFECLSKKQSLYLKMEQ